MSTATAVDATGLTSRFYQGSLGQNSAAATKVFQLAGWTSAYAKVLILVQDVNSNTNQLFYGAQFACVRQWDQPATLKMLEGEFNSGTGLYTADVSFDSDNNFVVTIKQGGFDTVTSWKLQVEYMFGR